MKHVCGLLKSCLKKYDYQFNYINEIEQQVVIEKVKNNLSWVDVCGLIKAKGKADVIKILRGALVKIIENHHDFK